MFQTTSSVGILSGLLLAAVFAGSAAAEARDGGVELVARSRASVGVDVDDVAQGAAAKLTITGLDRSFRTQLEVARTEGTSRLRVALPAGLYAIAGSASLGEGGVIPASSAPKLVVVAAGRVTTVNVSVDVESPGGAAVAALDH